MKQKFTITFALLMILFSTAIPGVYALEDNTGASDTEMPEMDADQMKEMTLEMIENSIDSLTTLQSELDDEDLLESADSLLEEMESLKTELEATDDEDEISAIMEDFRSLMEDAPDEIREELMQNGPMGGDGQGPMDGNRTMMTGDESMQPSEGGFPGNGTMNGEAPTDRQENEAVTDDETGSESTSEENNGLLSGLINLIKSLF